MCVWGRLNDHSMAVELYIAREVWDTIRKTYYKVKDASHIYDLNAKMV